MNRSGARAWRARSVPRVVALALVTVCALARVPAASSDLLAPADGGVPGDSLSADSDTATVSAELPEDAPEDRDYEAARERAIAPSEVELGYALASRAGGRMLQRRRVHVRESGLEAEVREGRGDALAGAALGTRVPGGRLALGRASPRWARGVVIGLPIEPWRSRALASSLSDSRARNGDAAEFRHQGRVPLDLMAARDRRDAFAAARLSGARGALEFALSRAAGDRRQRVLAGVALAGVGADLEAGLDARGAWRLEASRGGGAGPLSLTVRLGHFDFQGTRRPRVASPPVAFGAALSGRPRRDSSMRLEGSCWRFPGGQTGSRAALEVRAELAQHESVSMGYEERRGSRRFAAEAPATGALRQGVWAEWSRGGPGLAMNLRHEWWGQRAALRDRVRELASAALESRARPGVIVAVAVQLYRAAGGEPQVLTESETDRTVWRVMSGAGHRTRLRVTLPAAGGSVRAALTVSRSGGSAPPPQWTIDWTRRARTR